MLSKFWAVPLALAGLGVSMSAGAQSRGLDLVRTSNCLACHQIDQKRIGPSFTLVSQRFAGQEGALAYLAQAIQHGGRGRWGAVPMPAQPQVSPADAQTIAAWILSLSEPNLLKPSLKP